MKYRVTLTDAHQMVLAVMHHAGGPVRKRELSHVIAGHEVAASGFGHYTEFLLENYVPLFGEKLPRIRPAREFTLPDPNRKRPPDTLTEALVGLKAFGLLREQEKFGVLSSLDDDVYELTLEGKRIAESIAKKRYVIFRPPSEEQKHIFVASAFGNPQLDRLYENELAPACVAVGLQPYRVDLREPDATITAAILDNIASARALVADLTLARPSVYFEVGLAHGLGVPILLTCRADHYRGTKDTGRVHFDLQQYKISFWRHTDGRFRWPRTMNPVSRLERLLGVEAKRGLTLV